MQYSCIVETIHELCKPPERCKIKSADQEVLLWQEVIEIIQEGLQYSFSYCDFTEMDSKKISTTNKLERLNCEIRCRKRVVEIFLTRNHISD